ncbi:MAG: prepilin-type N-terminal cleavage/methylation domain-containing protein [Mariprofundales bacterium]
MPTLVTGNNNRGFTLLEIMLVLTIIVTLVSISVPYLFRSDSDILHDESRLLMQKLRLAATETQFTGRPMRCNFFSDRYVFEQWDIDGSWLASDDDNFAEYRFTNLEIDDINAEDYSLGNDINSSTEQVLANSDEDDNADGDNYTNDVAKADIVPPLGRIVFFPDGMLSFADITLRSKEVQIKIEVRPGPGGISLIKDNKDNKLK